MSEIEKQFFEAFGIPPLCCKKYITNCTRYDCENCENFDNTFSTYPKITDHILLRLICYLSRYKLELVPDHACFKTIDQLKENVLKCAMSFMSGDHKPMLYLEDVQELFKK